MKNSEKVHLNVNKDCEKYLQYHVRTVIGNIQENMIPNPKKKKKYSRQRVGLEAVRPGFEVRWLQSTMYTEGTWCMESPS